MSDITNDLLPRVAVLEEIASATKIAFDRIDRQFDRIDHRLDSIEANQRSRFLWLLGTIGASYLSLLLLMLAMLTAASL
jgi:hypothetical protein